MVIFIFGGSILDNNNFLKAPELVETVVNNYAGKAPYSSKKIALLAIMAGIFIGLGGMISGISSHTIENYGLAKFMAGSIFPVGLILVVITGAELFTGNVMMITPVIKGKIKFYDYIRNISLVWLFNLVGSVILAIVAYYGGVYLINSGNFGAYTIKVATGKLSIPFIRAIFSGILCNIMVCAAVYTANAAKDIIGKIGAIWFIICAFVIAGFEHVVANMYYLFAGLMAKLDPQVVKIAKESLSLGEDKIALINPLNILFNNLLPVTIGNILGGTIFFSVIFFFAFDLKKKDF